MGSTFANSSVIILRVGGCFLDGAAGGAGPLGGVRGDGDLAAGALGGVCDTGAYAPVAGAAVVAGTIGVTGALENPPRVGVGNAGEVGREAGPLA